MLPANLKAAQFTTYPPEARQLVVAHLGALRQLPLSFVPSLLKEWIDYDYKFPAERGAIDREVATLDALTAAQRADWFHAFAQIHLRLRLKQWIGSTSRRSLSNSYLLISGARTNSRHFVERQQLMAIM